MKKYYCITILALLVVTLLQGYNVSLQYKEYIYKEIDKIKCNLFYSPTCFNVEHISDSWISAARRYKICTCLLFCFGDLLFDFRACSFSLKAFSCGQKSGLTKIKNAFSNWCGSLTLRQLGNKAALLVNSRVAALFKNETRREGI